MYEDGWLSLMPEQQQHQHHRSVSTSSQSHGHRRKESLLQQPNVRGLEILCSGVFGADAHIYLQGTSHAVDVVETLENVYEEVELVQGPPEPELLRRAASYSDFYHVVRAQIHKDNRRRRKTAKKDRAWEALLLSEKADETRYAQSKPTLVTSLPQADLLETSQQEYMYVRVLVRARQSNH